MPKRAKYVLPLLAGALVLGVWLLWFREADGQLPVWGQGRLKISERGYYTTQVEAILKHWQLLADRAARDDAWQIIDPAVTCLTVDTTQRLVGIEKGGRLLPDHCATLPPQMDWTLYHSTPKGLTELPPLSRFRIRGLNLVQVAREEVILVGTLGTKEHFYFLFNSAYIMSGAHGDGEWIPASHGWQGPGNKPYESIVVTASEYAEAQQGFDRIQPSAFDMDKAERLKENGAAWARVEKRLYAAIEAYISLKGHALSGITMTPGPDYSAAAGHANIRRRGWTRFLRRGSDGTYTQFHIDHLGNNIWYIRSTPHLPDRSSKTPSLQMEFLVSAEGYIPGGDRERLLAEGRARQTAVVRPPSKWQATLPSGARVELIGICESPSGGKAWWGPDGSPLGYAPYINYERRPYERETTPAHPQVAGKSIYEIAWQASRGEENITPSMRLGPYRVSSLFNEVRDRYGRMLYSPKAECFGADPSEKTTSARVSVYTQNGPAEWVMFKNISLVPGQDMGFEIIQGDEAKPERP